MTTPAPIESALQVFKRLLEEFQIPRRGIEKREVREIGLPFFPHRKV